MKKNLKFIKLIPLLLLFSLLGTPISAFSQMGEDVPVDKQVLVFDNDNHNKLPERFRKSNDPIEDPGNLNLTGLKCLNISGSQQYSKDGLTLLKEQLPKDKTLVFFDLRQESHGFINGLPISFEGDGDKANMGLTHSQVIARNDAQLASIKIGTPITIKGTSITPKEVYSEQTLIKNNKDNYVRVTVTDTKPPTPEMVDYFVAAVNKLPKNSWLHFHCKEGIGRTTNFMTMYDMMKNAKTVPMNDIILRQIKLGNLEDKEKGLEDKERMALYTKFYAYCKKGDFTKKFSTFN
ncbi:MAG: fused DSP-PTPase phosphatase/NAD kinase-like protein [Clostridium sp.]|uniref:fused DSP-PTPase phosphatase/NAD kinase-like protein n=1 Tax=Clostridium sp. TaxID=1506 RepID=UPI003F3EC19C